VRRAASQEEEEEEEEETMRDFSSFEAFFVEAGN